MLISPFKVYKWRGSSQYSNKQIAMSNPFTRQMFIIPKKEKLKKPCWVRNHQNSRKYRKYSSLSCDSSPLFYKQIKTYTSSQKVSKQFKKKKEYYIEQKRVDVYGLDVLKVKNGYNVFKSNQNEDYFGKESKVIDDKYFKPLIFEQDYQIPENLTNLNKYQGVMLKTSSFSSSNKQNQGISYPIPKKANPKLRYQSNVYSQYYSQKQNHQKHSNIPSFGKFPQIHRMTSLQVTLNKFPKFEKVNDSQISSQFYGKKNQESCVISAELTGTDLIQSNELMNNKNCNNFTYHSSNGFQTSANSKNFHKRLSSNSSKSSKQTKENFMKKNSRYPSSITYKGIQFGIIYL